MIVLSQLVSCVIHATGSFTQGGTPSTGEVHLDLGVPPYITQVDSTGLAGGVEIRVIGGGAGAQNGDYSNYTGSATITGPRLALLHGSLDTIVLVVFSEGTLFNDDPTKVSSQNMSDAWMVLTYADGTVLTLRPQLAGVDQNTAPVSNSVDARIVLDPVDGLRKPQAGVGRNLYGGLIDAAFAGFLDWGIPRSAGSLTSPDWLIIDEPTLGFTDRTVYMSKDPGAHSFTQQLRQRGQASVRLFVAAGDTYVPTQFTQVLLYDQTETYLSPRVSVWQLVFIGFIQDIEIQWIGTRGDRFVTITGVSLESIFDTVYAPPKQYQAWTCGQIVRDLLDRLESGSPVSAGAISDGPVIPLLVTNYEKLSELFDQLATTAEFTWSVNPQTQELFFGAPSTVPSPFTLASSNILWDSVNWKQTGADYRNRQAVRLSYDAFAHSCEFFVGAGQRTITLARPVQQVTNAWATLSTCNTATATFTGQPNPGDWVAIKVPTGTWLANHIYALNGTLIDTNGFVQKVTTAGTSGGSLPTFSDITGGTTIDGTVIWTCQGAAGLATGDAVYTFVTALDNTQYGQVLIGATAADTCTNLMYAINATVDNGASPATQIRGIKYSLPTWENALCNAILQVGSTFTLQQKHAGTGWLSTLATSDTIAHFAWSSTTTSGGTSPQGSLGPGEGATISLQVYVQGTSVAAPGVAYTPGSNIVTLATPLNVGSNLNIEYTRADGNIIEVERTDLVTALAALSHGTGKYQQITDASSQGLISTSNVAGLQLAQQALASYDTSPEHFSFVCYDPGLYVGQQLAVTLTLPSGATVLLNGVWVIEEIDGELVPVDWNVAAPYLPGFGHYKYTVRCANIQEIGSYLDFWEGRGGGGSGSGGGGGAALAATSGGGLAPSTEFPAVIGFIMATGATGTNVGPDLISPRACTVSKCKFVTKTSDGTVDLTFVIKQNGTSVFTSPRTIAHGTSTGTVTTITALTSVPLSVAADDLFTIDISSGNANWQFTVQLEA